MAALSKPVLVADGHTLTASLIEAALRSRGLVNVEVQHTGRSALRSARRRRPELLILDLDLPELDGFQLLGRLARLEPGVPATLVLTSFPREVLQGLEDIGPHEFMAKPFIPRDLCEVALRLLRDRGVLEASTSIDSSTYAAQRVRVIPSRPS
jgi:DNA-binding response OmpR family regulator